MASFKSVVARALRIFGALAAGATIYFRDLVEVAATFHALKPACQSGWVISSYGMTLAPEAHASAAAADNLADACVRLESAWCDASVRHAVCSVIPYVYPSELRAVGRRREELLLRASRNFEDGNYEEAVLLVYSQIDGLFQDRAESAGPGYAQIFSRRPVREAAGGEQVLQFADEVRATKTMTGADDEFFLTARSLLTESVKRTTLGDNPSRHGVLHGRVLGYGTRTRAAQAFAFLAGAVEILVASWPRLPLTDEERYRIAVSELPLGLKTIGQAATLSSVRAVYVAVGQSPDATMLFATYRPREEAD